MKKLYIILTAAAVVAAVSCNKEVVPEVIEDSTPEQEQTQTLKNPITLTFTADALTKVSLSDEVAGTGKTVVWDDGDQIKIVWYANSQKDSTCATASNRNGSYATFTATVDGDAEYYYAVYPETLPTKLDGEGNFKVIFENKITCPTVFSGAAYYAARTTKEAKSFAFHPISTIVKCQVTSADTKRLYFRSMNGGLHQLYGHFPITFDEGNNLTVDSGANTSGNVTVKVENVAPCYYYIPLPARGSSETTGDDGFIIQRRDNSDKSLAPAAYYSGTITQAPGKLYKISTAVESKEISDYYVATDTQNAGGGLSQDNAETLENLKANVPAFKYSSNIGGAYLLDKATIHFLGGTYTSPLLPFNTNAYAEGHSYTIIGGADNTTTTFTTTSSSTFNNDKATITLQNVTFFGCSNASAVTISAGTVKLSNVTFQGNNNSAAAINGGAINISGGKMVSLEDCTFNGNKAGTKLGGAIYLNAGTTPLRIIGCKFVNNSCAGNSGGAISITNVVTGDIYITGSIFTGNTTGNSYYGAAIHAANKKASEQVFLGINNSLFYNNGTTRDAEDGNSTISVAGPHVVLNSTLIATSCTIIRTGYNNGDDVKHTNYGGSLIVNNIISNESTNSKHYALNTINAEKYTLRCNGYNYYSGKNKQVSVDGSHDTQFALTKGESASSTQYTWSASTYAWTWTPSAAQKAVMGSADTIRGLIVNDSYDNSAVKAKAAAFLTWLEGLKYTYAENTYNAFQVDINGRPRNATAYWPGCYQND